MRETCSKRPCAVDCVWGSWSDWFPECPLCLEEHVHEEDEEIPTFRERRIRKKGNKYGKCKDHKGRKFNSRRGKEEMEMTCPQVDWCKVGEPMWSAWTEWAQCHGECGGMGKRNRTRECVIEGGEAEDPNACRKFIKAAQMSSSKAEIDFAPCPNHCPLVGWSQWEEWTRCPVTCGGAQQYRLRRCLGGIKSEVVSDFVKKEFCNGLLREKQKRKCDMGPCRSSRRRSRRAADEGSGDYHQEEDGQDLEAIEEQLPPVDLIQDYSNPGLIAGTASVRR